MPAFAELASRHGLALVEDACQAHLATSAGRPVGTWGAAGAFSFYPTKNLGALGDAGAVITNDGMLADKLKRLRNGGQTDRYHHPEFGVNSRLDEMQAAILRARLPLLPKWTARRRALAAYYRGALANAAVRLPAEHDPGHVYHLFPVLTPGRPAFQAHLSALGVGTLVHYPIAIHNQAAFRSAAQARCPIAERIADEVCSIPLHPSLSDADAALVVNAVQSWTGRPEDG
jgi:dTDP-4-amino-4,6-dideoxygalactose transaminase